MGSPSDFDFSCAEPSYELFIKFKDFLDYDPESDIKIAAAAIVRIGPILNKDLLSETAISVTRLNRSVEYLEAYDLAEVHKHLGTHPFSFTSLESTRKTRSFVKASI